MVCTVSRFKPMNNAKIKFRYGFKISDLSSQRTPTNKKQVQAGPRNLHGNCSIVIMESRNPFLRISILGKYPVVIQQRTTPRINKKPRYLSSLVSFFFFSHTRYSTPIPIQPSSGRPNEKYCLLYKLMDCAKLDGLIDWSK